MSVGNNAIDRDHRYLICLINTVELAMQSTDDYELLLDALNQLENYTREHFRREEILQKKVNYPRHFQHLKFHHSLISQLNEIKTGLKKTIADKQPIDNADEIINLLRHWLLDHVLQEDLQMKPYFLQFSKDLI